MTQQFDIGVHYFLSKDYAHAARALQLVLREEPQHARAWAYLGIALSHLGQAAEAEAALSRAIAISPQNGEAWFHLGIARSLRQEWPEAASAYRHAVALIPEDMVAWHRLGVALAESGDEPASAAAFERALVLSRETGRSPSEEPIRGRDLDTHLEEAGEKETGREARSWIDLALSLLSLGEEEEAMSAYERAFNLDPERARRSLFRPMLGLVTAAAGAPVDDGPSAPDDEGPEEPYRPRPVGPSRRERRPEVG
ncbi:MAG: tetratricopeptide repeat protein [Thermoplasmata archaeon]|nr:tetratricopeptide repeat protein [Thermoplasmata archaeon]